MDLRIEISEIEIADIGVTRIRTIRRYRQYYRKLALGSWVGELIDLSGTDQNSGY